MKHFVGVLTPILAVLFAFPIQPSQAESQPNIIYLMLDEWGYFESGHMGNPKLLTPNIDQFAREGMRFTNAYAGAPVCGPTRCVLLTGLHSGHTSMRVNNGYSPIRENEPTLASMLQQQGYVTGGFGKWGIGGRGTSGVPEKHGFDEFFGYYDQVHAHTYYPQYLIRNSQEVALPGNTGTSFYEGETHAQLEIFNETLRFIRQNSSKRFFCYLPWTPPMVYGELTRMIPLGSYSKTSHGRQGKRLPMMQRFMQPSCIWWIGKSARFYLC